MSYNTRRTGGGGRGAPTTQVNYHQQPARPGSNTVQSRNPGYSTTTQPSNFVNSSSQPAYSTQAGYSTTATPPVPTSQTKPSQPQPPPAVAQPPLPPQPPAKLPVTPILKVEPVTPADTPQMDTAENGEGPAPRPFWKKKPFVKVSNKVRRARQNAKLRRILNPKNALTFLNELRPGNVKFVVREESGWGYVASVDIDGKTFSGHSLTVSKAKVQASEQALKHLLLEQLSKSQSTQSLAADIKEESNKGEGGETMETEEKEDDGEQKFKKPKMDHPEDDLPWGSLAAFALHKLFAEWQKEGSEAAHGAPQEKYDDEVGEEAYYTRRPIPPEFTGYPRRFGPGPFGRGRGFTPYPPRGPPPPVFGGGPRRPPPPAATFLGPRPSLPLGGVAPLSILPMKKIPEDANTRHPVMLLNQLKPNVIYNESREGEPPRVVFIISVEIDGKEYVGRGKCKKEAKKNAAKAALAPLGIVYDEDNN